jgi:hypothetical protein
VTHEYTLLIGATVLPGAGEAPAEAIAWAAGVVLAIGTDEQVLGISRGDSLTLDVGGRFVIPIGPDDDGIVWPPSRTLEIGSAADLAILEVDPRAPSSAGPPPLAILRAGHAVRGSLPAT